MSLLVRVARFALPLSLLLFLCLPFFAQEKVDYVSDHFVELNDNGARSWFMVERAIVHDNKLIVGSVRAVGTFQSGRDDPEWGNVEISVLDLATMKPSRTILHSRFEQDDHDSPSLL